MCPNCQKNVNLSTEREFINSMDNCLWHGQAMKCPLTVCLFVSIIVYDQNCPRDLDLSRKILTSLTDFLGPWCLVVSPGLPPQSGPISPNMHRRVCCRTTGQKGLIVKRFQAFRNKQVQKSIVKLMPIYLQPTLNLDC